jgi:hypothetical protein
LQFQCLSMLQYGNYGSQLWHPHQAHMETASAPITVGHGICTAPSADDSVSHLTTQTFFSFTGLTGKLNLVLYMHARKARRVSTNWTTQLNVEAPIHHGDGPNKPQPSSASWWDITHCPILPLPERWAWVLTRNACPRTHCTWP